MNYFEIISYLNKKCGVKLLEQDEVGIRFLTVSCLSTMDRHWSYTKDEYTSKDKIKNIFHEDDKFLTDWIKIIFRRESKYIKVFTFSLGLEKEKIKEILDQVVEYYFISKMMN